MEYNPFQAFLGSKQVQSRSPWPLHSTDESLMSPWQQPLQHPVFDDISTVGGKTSAMASFQPWRWYAAGTGLSLPSPSVTGVADANNLSPGRTKRPTQCSPSRTGLQTRTGSDLSVSGWHAGSNSSRFPWSTPGGDYDSYYPQQQQQQQQLLQHSNYNATYLGTSPTGGSNQYRGPGDNGSRLFETAVNVNVGDNNGVITSQGQPSAGSSSVDAMTAAVARYINDRWYSAAAGYGSTQGAGSTAGDGNDEGRLRPHQVGVSPHRHVAVDSRTDIYSAAVSGNIDLHLQPTGSSIRPGSLFAAPSNGSTSFPGGPWTWDATMTGGNSSYFLPSCGRPVTAETGENHGKHMTKSSSVMSEYDSVTSSRPENFRFPGFSSNSPSVNSSSRIPDVGGVNAASSENGTGKSSSEQKKSRNVDMNAGNSRLPAQRTGRQQTANSNSGSTTSNVGVRSTAAACECPNCREADRIGGVAGDHIRRLGQHSCHVPGCGKVYTKTSHLKAHLHWHNAGSVITSTSISSGSSMTSGGGSGAVRTTEPLTCIRPACRQRFSRLEDLQRHMKEHAADAVGPSSNSKKHASAKSKKQTGDDLVSEHSRSRSPTSNGMLSNEGTDSCVEKMARQAAAAGSSPASKTSLKRSPQSTGSSSGDVLGDVIVKRKRSAETPVGVDTADATSGDILSVQS